MTSRTSRFGLTLVLAAIAITRSAAPSPETPPDPAEPALLETYGKLPLSFEANHGQTDPNVKFLARGSGYTLFLTHDEAVLSLRDPESPSNPAVDPVNPAAPTVSATRVLRMRLVGASTVPKVVAVERTQGKINYFVGNDPSAWRTNVPTYAKVRYEAVYPGVNLVYYGNQQQLEYDFVVAAGADPDAIALAFQGADALEIDAQGDLVIRIDGRELIQRKPVVYQELDGARRAVRSRYRLEGEHVRFDLGDYDTDSPLIIDPIVSLVTYLGGLGADNGLDITRQQHGHDTGSVFVTGGTVGASFPLARGRPVQARYGGGVLDAFVTKFSPDGSALRYSTYLGGDWGDLGVAIEIDEDYNAYVTGLTGSDNFPGVGPLAGFSDVFVVSLNEDGTALRYATLLGGNYHEAGLDIAVDDLVDVGAEAYITGVTQSTDFPTVNALQTDLPLYDGNSVGGYADAFVTKLNRFGGIVFSTYLGGAGADAGLGIVAGVGAISVTGMTADPATGPRGTDPFPTTPGAFQEMFAGGETDAFVTQMATDGSAIIYSTLLGGSGADAANDITECFEGVCVTGETTDPGPASVSFPTTDAFQTVFLGGATDGFVTALNATGSDIVYSTLLGGSGDDRPHAIDALQGRVVVVGSTSSDLDFPLQDPTQPNFGGGSFDVFVTELNATFTGLEFSTFFGGNGEEAASNRAPIASSFFTTEIGRVGGMKLDVFGNLCLTGGTTSTNLPTTPGVWEPNFVGASDGFVACYQPGRSTGGRLRARLNVDFPRLVEQIRIIYWDVVRKGDTTLTSLPEEMLPGPSGFRVVELFEIASTVVYGGNVDLEFAYSQKLLESVLKEIGENDPAKEKDLRVLQWSKGWKDVTTTPVDTSNDIVHARTRELGLFAVVLRVR